MTQADRAPTRHGAGGLALSPVVAGTDVAIGTGFRAIQYRHGDYSERAMSPFVMVDHFHMTSPTFDVHPHAGMSAVTLMFEDTCGEMKSVDSIGHRSTFGAGDLHWTLAGRGILHTQLPADSRSRIHALQIFVNLPEASKSTTPDSFKVAAADMPEITKPGLRLRVVAGSLDGSHSPAATPHPILMLDGYLQAIHDPLTIPLQKNWNAWVLVIDGTLKLDGTITLTAGQTVCVNARTLPTTLTLETDGPSHFVMLGGPRIDEPVIQHGPFVFTNGAAVEQALRDLKSGRFGQIPDFS